MILATSTAAFVIPAASASAQSRGGCGRLGNFLGWNCGGSGGGSRVPEIDASTGLLALAAVSAALALVWEIKRIRNKRG
ncbi:MAG: VPEID-CTERM sorting domain-containing protein [Pseudodonghicola sp.]|nr:VPEID-CTERM sorting domain-containing protein [Pseudodonghicola sp.]